MRSKEEKIIELFFDNPSKEWHFEEILKEAKITRSKASMWLKKFIKEGLIKRIKERKSMPYYVGNNKSANYKNRKRIFALSKLHESGLLNHLYSLKNADAVIIFGSFSRSDWYKNSDIDIFIYGDEEGLKIADYELRLGRDVQPFLCRSKEELAKLSNGLIKNIIKGDLIRGNIDFIKVEANA